jgi:phosphonate transport system substrate-binding protein
LFSFGRFIRLAFPLTVAAFVAIVVSACGGDDDEDSPSASGSGASNGSTSGSTLYIGGIPDQDVAILEKRFNLLAEYLTEETGIKVEYLPSTDYAAVVTAFRNGDMHLAWYGGLTGVQARLQVEGAVAVVQRETDEAFTSVFVAAPGSGIESLADLEGKHFAFGSESSTSGNLMPRYYLQEDADLNPEEDFASVTYSGSHDATWKLVEAGTADAGALNASVWKTRVEAGEVDQSKVDAFYTTPPYYDYHWVARPDLDEEFGDGATQKIVDAMLAIDPANGGIEAEIYEAFESSRFIATRNENYDAIEAIGRQLGLIE